jgi:TM2 domain-containing membrane protein YozV
MAQNFCPNCGAGLQYKDAEVCPTCGVRIRQAEPERKKEPVLSAVLNFIFAGSGQVYNGELGKGILFLFGTVIGVFIFFFPGLIIWIYGIYDAYTTAVKMNRGEIPFRDVTAESVIVYILVFIAAIILAIFLAIAIAAIIFGAFLGSIL